MNTIKPSDSPPLNADEIARVKKVLGGLTLYIKTEYEAGAFSSPAANWDTVSAKYHYDQSKKLFECNPIYLRFFRFLTQCFSGYSLYHQRAAAGMALPNDATQNEAAIDRYWIDTVLPDETYQMHLQMTYGLPLGLIYQPPIKLGEAGWIKDGRFISVDQIDYQMRISLLYFSGLIAFLEKKIAERGEIKILEIGGGYGALAYALKHYFPQASYTIIDLPESLAFAGTYLTLLRPDLHITVGAQQSPFGFRLTPVTQAQEINEEFGLVINTLSMAEMADYQVAEYGRLIKEMWIKKGGFFFEQNVDNRTVGYNNPELIIGQYLERKAVLNWQRCRVTHGKPSVWQAVGNNSNVVLSPHIPAIGSIKIMEIGVCTITQGGVEGFVQEHGIVPVPRDERASPRHEAQSVFRLEGRL